jgi:Na+-translocating ferredoxin:NAD+ oxidoreductase subunit B
MLLARLACRGGKDGPRRRLRKKFTTCSEAHGAMPGKVCSYGCLGLGECAEACPTGAITISPQRLPTVDTSLCVGCGQCSEVCPRAVLVMHCRDNTVAVSCRSPDSANSTELLCTKGCTGCNTCERVCPFSAIRVIENLAVIDYELCRSCGICSQWCPRGTISAAGS